MFVLLYVVVTVLLLPAVVLTLGAGALFGVAWAFVTVSIAATLGATAAFLVGRYLARGWVARRVAASARLGAIDAAVAREGWKIVLLTRLSPAFPFVLLNYAFGLTRVPLRDYVAGLLARHDARHRALRLPRLAGGRRRRRRRGRVAPARPGSGRSTLWASSPRWR